MKTRMHATIGIQTTRGVYFGTTDWIKGRTLQFRIDKVPQLNEEVVLKIEIPDGGSWLMAEARILRTAESSRDETTRVLARITSLGHSDMKRLRRFLKNSIREQPTTVAKPIPLHEPTIHLSPDGRKLTAKWQDARAFRRDWALHLVRGRLPATGEPPHRRAFMMRIMMPDGFVTTFPAEIGEKIQGGWLVRFLVPHDAFSRMRTFAERRSAKVV